MSDAQNIRICKLPYQRHPFVHGTRDSTDVWLLNNGEWTERDGHEDASIHLQPHLVIVQTGKAP